VAAATPADEGNGSKSAKKQPGKKDKKDATTQSDGLIELDEFK
jgi:hypothetical protein